jgi:hypothetical protein
MMKITALDDGAHSLAEQMGGPLKKIPWIRYCWQWTGINKTHMQ